MPNTRCGPECAQFGRCDRRGQCASAHLIRQPSRHLCAIADEVLKARSCECHKVVERVRSPPALRRQVAFRPFPFASCCEALDVYVR